MANTHDTFEMERLGIRVHVLCSGQDTAGELFDMEVSGSPRGFSGQRHVHTTQVERLEILAGSMKVGMNGTGTHAA